MNVSMYLSVKWRVGIAKLDYIEHIVPFFLLLILNMYLTSVIVPLRSFSPTFHFYTP